MTFNMSNITRVILLNIVDARKGQRRKRGKISPKVTFKLFEIEKCTYASMQDDHHRPSRDSIAFILFNIF